MYCSGAIGRRGGLARPSDGVARAGGYSDPIDVLLVENAELGTKCPHTASAAPYLKGGKNETSTSNRSERQRKVLSTPDSRIVHRRIVRSACYKLERLCLAIETISSQSSGRRTFSRSQILWSGLFDTSLVGQIESSLATMSTGTQPPLSCSWWQCLSPTCHAFGSFSRRASQHKREARSTLSAQCSRAYGTCRHSRKFMFFAIC